MTPSDPPPGPSRRDRLPSAVAFMALASLAFAVMGVFVKASTASLPFPFALLFRNSAGLLPLVAWYVATGRRPRAVRPRLLFLRALLGVSAMFLFFLAIDGLPLSTATVLNYSSPVFVVLISAASRRRARDLRLLPLVLAAFAGVGVLAGFQAEGSGPAVAAGVASAVLAVLAVSGRGDAGARQAPASSR